MSYIETYTGKRVDILLPDAEQICIEDIAHALAQVPRFAGHGSEFYSVAQHSLNVAALLPKHLKLQGLLHDATEAYLGDMPTPFKALLPDYQAAEQRMWNAISFAFYLPKEVHPSVKQADKIMLMSERDRFKSESSGYWGQEYEDTLRVEVEQYFGQHGVERAFLAAYNEYKKLVS